MYIIPVAWLYVVLMMSVAEATSPQGTVLGAFITLILYGLLPIALLLYFMGTPGRRRALRARDAAEQHARANPVSLQPDAGSLATTDAVAPVREEA